MSLKLLKRVERDSDDDATLTEIMEKKRVLEEKKKELDEKAAAALTAKKSKLQKETPPAPSKSEIDLGVFSAKHGNLLEKIFATSGSQGTKFCICILFFYLSSIFLFRFSDHHDCFVTGAKLGKAPRKVDISKITPPTSPPSRTFGLSPPHVDRGKRKEDDVEVEQVREGGGDAGGVGDVGAGAGTSGGGGAVVQESSEATPHQIIYTKVIRGSGQGGASGTHHSPEYEHAQGGFWDTHNPACADLPHAPRWNLTQGSRMTELTNCHEFFSLSLPPAKRLFQKRRNRLDLLDDHIHAGVHFFATSQEIAREWQLMGEDTLEFENAKKAFAKEREKFNAEKKGLAWRVADAEEKLAKEKQVNVDKQKDWEVACERTNKELQSQRDAIVRLSVDKRKISDEAEQERAAHQKREQEYIQRIEKLEKFAAEKVAESKASEILAEEISADCKWLLAHAVPLISERIAKSDELAKYMFEVGQAAYNSVRKYGYGEGRAVAMNKENDYHFELFKEDCTTKYTAKRQEYEFIEFGIVKSVEKLSQKPNAIEVLKKAIGDQRTDGGDAGPSHQG
ncbi:hypothetical protein HanPI659440_Chr14g0558761 [Helianthus annuus]|nr:hypothetical protein HanPI659440_Chr14g0558761 [Helianthus annuus]